MPYALWPWVNFSGHFSMSLYISPSTPLSAADAAHAAQGIFAYAGDLVISLNPFASDSSADGAASSTGTAVTVMANDQPSIFDQEFKRFEQKHGAPAQPAAPARLQPRHSLLLPITASLLTQKMSIRGMMLHHVSLPHLRPFRHAPLMAAPALVLTSR